MNQKTALYLLFILFLYSPPPWADTSYIDTQMVNNEKISQKEISLMDPVCRLILIEKPGIHLRKNMSGREILNSPLYEMAQDAPFLHHRCWALIAKQRYFSTNDKGKKSQHLGAFNSDMNYVIKNAPKNWKFLPQAYTELGQMNLLLRYYSGAILAANKAINLSRTYVDAYVLLADAYRGLGGSDSQIKKYILEGLTIEPGNKQLMRRAKNMHLTVPEKLSTPTQAKTEIEDKNANLESQAIEQKSKTDTSKELITKETPTSSERKLNVAPPPGESGVKQAPRKNPYCRFCPD